jgi:hypothetical protein
VDVLIRLEHAEPPAGLVLRLRDEERMAAETGDALQFVGWLGLLRALSELVREAGEGTGG